MRSTRTQLFSRGKGFTLVELLVVVGIIALLISILLPALTSARKQANSVKCLAYLREIGHALNLYAHNNRGVYPVVRQDLPDNMIATFNMYWQDMIAPYVTSGKMNFMMTGTTAQQQAQFEQARNSVLWGCPGFEGYFAGGTFGVNRNNNGYAMNLYPTVKPGHPANPAAMPGPTEMNVRWFGVFPGRYHKIAQWSHPAEKMLVADSILWFFEFQAVPIGGQIGPQLRSHVAINSGAASNPGGNNFDRYRHGKYPTTSDASNPAAFDRRGGKVAFNILYADGHAATCSTIEQGYHAVRLINP